MLARALHMKSPRRDGPFVEVSCSATKPTHLERELFGQKTSAGIPGDKAADRPGKLVQADGGTLFLNEVGALSPDLQFKLLRLLQDMAFEPVDSTQTVRVDVRIVVASSEDLAALVAQGQFRQDLFDRLSSVTLKLPPLRQRGADIEALAQHFRSKFARAQNKDVTGFAPEAITLMREHTWPANVRELESAVERSVVVCRGPKIVPANLALNTSDARPDRVSTHTPKPHVAMGIRPLKEALEEPEKQLILQALEALNWNRQETARVLDINRTTLYKKMKKYGLLAQEPAWMN
jgi:two-component system response regulator HydG